MRTDAAWLLSIALALAGVARGAGDPDRGAGEFRQCAACHSTAKGEHRTGPSLAGVWGRKAGTAMGFGRYSEALRKADVVWGPESLDHWLADPARYVPGNTMTFAGVRGSRDREDLIAYLRAVSEGSATSGSSQRRGRMGMMGGGKIDLKKAPPAGQVESIRYCGDAYTVRTADGKESKVWEFNLRFKTDSSSLGPPEGRPVVIGAGMRGDRASVVFATPEEIGSFIKRSCNRAGGMPARSP